MISRTLSRPQAALVAAAFMTLALVVTWRVGPWDAPPPGAQSAAASGSTDTATGLTLYPVTSRTPVPDISGSTLEGDQLALADLRGQVVVVNVWGSWCAPCRAEALDLARAARETAEQGVRFVGIDTRDNLAAARAFVETFDVPYPSLFDEGGELLVAFNGVVPVSAVPSTLVIDPDGRIAARVVGKVTYDTLRGIIDDLLAGPRSQRSATPTVPAA